METYSAVSRVGCMQQKAREIRHLRPDTNRLTLQCGSAAGYRTDESAISHPINNDQYAE